MEILPSEARFIEQLLSSWISWAVVVVAPAWFPISNAYRICQRDGSSLTLELLLLAL